MSQTSSQDDSPPSEVAALKRRLAVLEAQNAELRKQPVEEKSKLNKGADGARADDTTRLKVTVASWLMQQNPPPNPVIQGQNKIGRGFNNNATGRLICPVDYDWNDPIAQQGIRDYHPDYRVTTHSWPAFVYKDETYDPQNPTNGLFQGTLLLKTYKYIFTSPTSAEMEEGQEQLSPELLSMQGNPKQRRTDGERRTHCDVAGLLNMKSVHPRSIAYAAVQLRFALSSTGSWCVIDDEFNHQEFYNNIVDSLELSATTKEVEDLLLWWNRKVFGRKHVSTYQPQRVEQLSVARCSGRR
ncbi:hypothetical protein CY34DRAFT_25864 [Suillus luteus UH-Slu-Lm8-n1]|uniref:Uncharacterized protein n=1 Tax=Suillus luteus UH-Slu-Lm8-n1 TaxID=930992 RepID=A0A0C9ZK46_9AGAM|nr:hypothetical protein CY34DRAFT_25864 [Suillus luteus UH-Slu-Lm8-n1]